MLLNKKAIRDYVISMNPELRTSKEFFETLENIIRERIEKAVRRNRSLAKKTLGQDQLFM